MNWLIVSVVIIFGVVACGESSSKDEIDTATDTDIVSGTDSGSDTASDTGEMDSRAFLMGFTPWPYDATLEAVDDVYDKINLHGDIVAHHLDGGIPWQAALDETAYPQAVEDEIQGRLNRQMAEQAVYLAVSPFNTLRDGLAGEWNDAGTGQPLSAPWDSLGFDAPDVQNAYIYFATDMIARFQPTYFNLGIEASELALNDATLFAGFVEFTAAVSAALKSVFPEVKLMISVALKSPHSEEAQQIATAMAELVPYVDVMGASVYPYVFFQHDNKGNPDNLPPDWLSQIQQMSGDKPVAVTETGWIAEPLQIATYGVDVNATPEDQSGYVETLCAASKDLNAEFIIWFTVVDFDALWNGVLAQDPLSQIWRDTGLYDSALVARPALATWDSWLAR